MTAYIRVGCCIIALLLAVAAGKAFGQTPNTGPGEGAGPSHDHSLYDGECCGTGDCSQVDCDELIEDAKGLTHYKSPEGWTIHFSKGGERLSKTKRCGVCYNRYPDREGGRPTGERWGYCVYKQWGY